MFLVINVAAAIGLATLMSLLSEPKREAAASSNEQPIISGPVRDDEATARARDEDDTPKPPVSLATENTGLSYENYQRIREGMTYPEVVAILGSNGEELSRTDIAGYTTVMYSWHWTGANMNAVFQNGRLVQKAQFGLR